MRPLPIRCRAHLLCYKSSIRNLAYKTLCFLLNILLSLFGNLRNVQFCQKISQSLKWNTHNRNVKHSNRNYAR